MALFVDFFGYLSVVLRGCTLAAQALAIGGVAFLLCVARPRAPRLGEAGHAMLRRCRLGIVAASLGLALFALLSLGSDLAALIEILGLERADPLHADFVRAGMAQAGSALVLAALVTFLPRPPAALLVLPALGMLAGSTATSHAAARLEHQWLLSAVTFLHEGAACTWVGALPYLLASLSLPIEGKELHPLGRRFHGLATVSVGTLFAGAAALSYAYVGALDGFYGTAYGVMVGVKAAMAFTLLGLGYFNSRRIEALKDDPEGPLLALRRFTEVEIGIGVTVFLATASLISVPPAVDLRENRLTLAELGARMTPTWPRFTSPDHESLALQVLQKKLDADAAARGQQAAPAYVPGAGMPPPYKAEDVAWSEYNHHWAGVFVLAIGLLALYERIFRARWARSWPLLFAGLAVFLLIRSDPEAWPMGSISFWASFREPEVAQHRIFMALITVFAFFEWGVRTGRTRSPRAALVLPLLCALGGALLLTHSHALGNVKEELLIEYTHAPLALLGVAAGWSRWLEVRLPGSPAARRASWIWPTAFALVGLLLILYREA
ncbi:MAG TPA: CopD family protein [Myxococcota bacterium]|nr:CopD family protein [Myxococcota bacterium]